MSTIIAVEINTALQSTHAAQHRSAPDSWTRSALPAVNKALVAYRPEGPLSERIR